MANPHQSDANRPEPTKDRRHAILDGRLKVKKGTPWAGRLASAGRDEPPAKPKDSWTFFRYWRADPKDPNGVVSLVYLDEQCRAVGWKEFVPYKVPGFLPPVPE